MDQGLIDFYRSLVPKILNIKPQAYKGHISVIRKEIPQVLYLDHFWGAYEGEEIEFQYRNDIQYDETYCWIPAYSARLSGIRTELGLPPFRRIKRPEHEDPSYHITLGNFKHLRD